MDAEEFRAKLRGLLPERAETVDTLPRDVVKAFNEAFVEIAKSRLAREPAITPETLVGCMFVDFMLGHDWVKNYWTLW